MGMKSKGYAKGGMKTKGYSKGGRRQNSNDRLDESLGMKDGKESGRTYGPRTQQTIAEVTAATKSSFRDVPTPLSQVTLRRATAV